MFTVYVGLKKKKFYNYSISTPALNCTVFYILFSSKNLCHSENLKDMSSLAGKAVIVTGSSSGIGLATAVLCAKKGANVTVCGRDVGRLQEAVKACEKAGKDAGHKNKIITSTGDISDSTVIKNTVEQTVKAFGGLDVLVTNHGANMLKGNESIEAWTRECFDTCMNTNVRSVIELVQQAVPHLEKNRGNVVCVSSLGSVSPMSQSLNYLISKAALDHAVRCLAMQLGAKGTICHLASSFLGQVIRRYRCIRKAGWIVFKIFGF